uniref:HPP transmembrane region domain-containing protein n=1 Tax=Hyphomicrobium sp. JC17 TaxID=142666 RepID=Q93UW0_9HYPH|nr:hypothetical protein [Hyphomicrobium sp. JC17]
MDNIVRHRARFSAAPFRVAALAGFGGFLAIFALGYARDLTDFPLLIPPFGASCVLAFGYPASPFAHPKNIIGGHFLSAAIGLLACAVAGYGTTGAALGVGMAICAMMLSDTTHPPAGANPIVVAILKPDPTFLLSPVLLGAVAIVLIGRVFHRVASSGKAK